MSKTLTHGKPDSALTGDHTRRISAIERNLSLEQARYGIPALRDRLFLAAGVARGEQSRNFEPGLAPDAITLASGGSRWCACYWPGGTTSGMTFLLTTVGVYTDTSPNSGGAIYSYDGVTLTRQATQPQKWDATFGGTGLNRLQWAIPVNLVEGVYYVAIRYFNTSVTTVPTFGGTSASDGTVWGADANQDATPANWPLQFSASGATGQLPSTQSAGTLVVGSATTLPYVGLF